MSLAAVPVYLLVRRLGGGAWAALAAAALTVVSPDLFFSSFLLADAIAYPLVLGAVYVGVRALAEPSRRLQLGFAALAVLATFARDPVRLPAARLRGRRARRRARLGARRSGRASGSRCCSTPRRSPSPPCSGPKRLLGYYSGVADLHVRPGDDRPLARHRRDAARLRGRLRARPGRDRRDRARPLEAELARGVRLRRARRRPAARASSPRRRSTRRTAPTASRSAT